MENFLNISVIWFVIGLALLLLEFAVPGFILFFFGVGAWMVAIICLFVDISLTTQLLVFLLGSTITLLIFRKLIKNKFGLYSYTSQQLEDEFIGKIAVAETDINSSQNGKVVFKGTIWDASSDDDIKAGQSIVITGTKSIILIVKLNHPQ